MQSSETRQEAMLRPHLALLLGFRSCILSTILSLTSCVSLSNILNISVPSVFIKYGDKLYMYIDIYRDIYKVLSSSRILLRESSSNVE